MPGMSRKKQDDKKCHFCGEALRGFPFDPAAEISDIQSAEVKGFTYCNTDCARNELHRQDAEREREGEESHDP